MEDFPRLSIKRGGNGASPEAPVPLIKCWEVIRNCYCTADKKRAQCKCSARWGKRITRKGEQYDLLMSALRDVKTLKVPHFVGFSFFFFTVMQQ